MQHTLYDSHGEKVQRRDCLRSLERLMGMTMLEGPFHFIISRAKDRPRVLRIYNRQCEEVLQTSAWLLGTETDIAKEIVDE